MWNSPEDHETTPDVGMKGDGLLAKTVNRLISLEQLPFLKTALLWLPPWITPDCISIFRMTLAVPVIGLLAWNRFQVPFLANIVIAAAIVFAVSVSLDAVDGWLARARRKFSSNGASLDPFCDKLTLVLVLLGILVFGECPRYVLVASLSVVALEAGVQASRLYQSKRTPTANQGERNSRVRARWHGKLKMDFESVGALAFVLAPLAPGWLWTVGTVAMVPALLFGTMSLISKLRDK
jgi:phosphatidylglycerophosphate synthase